ncbi:MAG: magnesium transporter [Armatimonadetes bacterium]|nr:magnesium transporter [Armatimonadota bacterium]
MAPDALYLSELLGVRVSDALGRRVGWVSDLVIHPSGLFPSAVALVVRQPGPGARSIHVPWTRVRRVSSSHVVLDVPGDRLQTRPLTEGDVLLAAEVLDKQLVDTLGRRVVKVNDLKLIAVRSELRVLGVDVGARGILRRLGLEGVGDRVGGLIRRSLSENLIPWNYVESVAARGANVRLSVPSSRLERLRPADISRILSQLPAEDRAAAASRFSDETLAEAMGDLDAPVQLSIIDGLERERASDILERMAPDEATDLLQDLPEERQAELLTLMARDDAAELSELLQYDERSAGGLMTTEYIALPAEMTAQEAIEHVRRVAPGAETVYYLYVVDPEERLMGVLSLRALITAAPNRRVAEIMTTSVVSVPVEMDQEDVAAAIARYHLLAVPVVNAQGRLLGIVTVDDTIDVVDEEAEEDLSHIAGTPAETPEELRRGASVALTRMPWLLLALTAGFFAAAALHALVGPLLVDAAPFLPLLFLLGGQVAAQTAASTARGIALREIDRGNWWRHSLAEARLSAVVAAAAGLVAGAAATAWAGPEWGVPVGLSAAAVVLAGSVLGLLVPLAGVLLYGDPAWALRPIVISLMAVAAPALYAAFLRVFLR